MKKVLPFLAAAAIAGPALAQEAEIYHASDAWPVHRLGASCSMERQGQADTGFGRLAVGYDAARGEVTLSTSAPVERGLPPSGSIPLHIVFLDNGRVKHDDQWASRTFAYTSEDGIYRFTAAFAGEKNARQILADLAGSRRLGLLHEGEVLFDHDLAGARDSLGRMQACAARAVAAN